ncbi:MAG: extensin family protein [Hyphomicrobiales bacterium]
MIDRRPLPHRIPGLIATGVVLCMTAPLAQANDSSRPLAPVGKALNQMGEDFCQSFKLNCQKKARSGAGNSATAKPKAKPARPTAAAASDSGTSAVPMPRQKPQRPSQQAAAEPPAAVPVPREKPFQDKSAEAMPAPDTPASTKTATKQSPPAASASAVPPQKVPDRLPAETEVASAPPPKPDKTVQDQSPTPVAPAAPAATVTPKVPDRLPEETVVASAPSTAPVVDANCLSALRKAGVQFETAESPTESENCRVASPVRVDAVETTAGRIVLPERPLLNCAFALQFSRWLSDAAAPGVMVKKNIRLARVATGPGYDCRGRNGDSTAKISEHAAGNAVDVTTLTLEDGKVIQVADAGDQTAAAYELLRGLRTTACGYFTTVLGPGANSAHATHFHFDLGRHGKSDSYRICE